MFAVVKLKYDNKMLVTTVTRIQGKIPFDKTKDYFYFHSKNVDYESDFVDTKYYRLFQPLNDPALYKVRILKTGDLSYCENFKNNGRVVDIPTKYKEKNCDTENDLKKKRDKISKKKKSNQKKIEMAAKHHNQSYMREIFLNKSGKYTSYIC